MSEIRITVREGQVSYTKILQDAIDFCSRCGGGTIYIEKGVYRIETIFLRSNIRLYLEQEAVLKGNPDTDTYPADVHRQMYADETHMDRCLFFADRCENIVLEGYGTIDGSGLGKAVFSNRPMMFRYLECKNVRIQNIRMKDPCSWTNAFIGCENIWVHGVEIASSRSGNGDGLDFDGCRNVFVSDCLLDCGDDCICLQNSYFDRPCENITVSGCTFRTKWAGMRIGLLSCGPIRNLTVTNCIFREIKCSGLKIQSAEGSVVENLVFSNLIMENVVRPVLITANRFRRRVDTPEPIVGISTVRNLMFHNLICRCTDSEFLEDKKQDPKCMILDSTPEDCIENVRFSHVSMTLPGETPCPEQLQPADQPIFYNHKKRGLLPAYGLYARNVQDLYLRDFQVCPEGNDNREKIFCRNSRNIYEEGEKIY